MKNSNHLPYYSADSSSIPTPRLLKKMYRRAVLGFTLFEMLVALGMSSIGLTAGIMVYTAGGKLSDVSQTTAEAQQGFRKALATMALEIQETKTSMIDTSVPHCISFASARQSNVFQTNSDGSPNWQNAVVFFLDSGTNTLCRYTEARSNWSTSFDTASALEAEDPEQLVKDVTDLDFHLSGNVLTIIMEISKNLRSADSTSPIATELAVQIYLRN